MLACLLSFGRRDVCMPVLMLLAISGTWLSAEPDYDEIWSNAKLYENADNPFMQNLALSGRLQWEAYSFDSDQGNANDTLWRRFRFGFKSTVFENWTLHSEADLDLNGGKFYNRLTDTYMSRSLGNATIKIGKQSAGFTLDGATSSKSLITLQRSNLTNNLWFTAEYFTGVSVSGESDDGWLYDAGVFSTDGNGELSHFDAGYFGLVSVGRDFSESVGIDSALIRLDIVENEKHAKANTRSFGEVISLVSKWEDGNWGLWTDLSFGDGHKGQSDLWGFSAMPFFYLNEKLQLVFRYTHMGSDNPNGVRLGRYESSVVSGRGDQYDELYAGFNVFFYGHKLKWQTGVKSTKMKDSAKDGGEYTGGLGVTTGLRISW
ncbi:MAG: porin [Verrucomicrobia bacterium]|nr:porin [Verrucomicrobiota bacterium]MDA1068527.1 porin [Verrucomicrobiota bacterium]